jgi:hypothetical protein
MSCRYDDNFNRSHIYSSANTWKKVAHFDYNPGSSNHLVYNLCCGDVSSQWLLMAGKRLASCFCNDGTPRPVCIPLLSIDMEIMAEVLINMDQNVFDYAHWAGWTSDQIKAYNDSFEPEFDPSPSQEKYEVWKKELKNIETQQEDDEWEYVGPRTYWLKRNIKAYEEKIAE